MGGGFKLGALRGGDVPLDTRAKLNVRGVTLEFPLFRTDIVCDPCVKGPVEKNF